MSFNSVRDQLHCSKKGKENMGCSIDTESLKNERNRFMRNSLDIYKNSEESYE